MRWRRTKTGLVARVGKDRYEIRRGRGLGHSTIFHLYWSKGRRWESSHHRSAEEAQRAAVLHHESHTRRTMPYGTGVIDYPESSERGSPHAGASRRRTRTRHGDAIDAPHYSTSTSAAQGAALQAIRAAEQHAHGRPRAETFVFFARRLYQDGDYEQALKRAKDSLRYANKAKKTKRRPRCRPHYMDNQGLCHNCGILLDEDRWRQYAGPSGPLPSRRRPPLRHGNMKFLAGHPRPPGSHFGVSVLTLKGNPAVWYVAGPRVLRGGRVDYNGQAYYGTINKQTGEIHAWGGRGAAGKHYRTYLEEVRARIKRRLTGFSRHTGEPLVRVAREARGR